MLIVNTMTDTPDFEYLYNNISCGILTFRSGGKINSANQVALDWTGLTKEEIYEQNFTDLLDKGGKIYFQLFIQPLLKLNSQINEISININGKNGYFPCLFTASVLEADLDVATEPTVVVTIFKVSDRKKYEVELLNAKLQSQEREDIKTQSLEDVAQIQAHLVRAPLASILGLVSLLKDMEIDDPTRTIVSMLSESAEKLDQVIKDIIKKTEI